MHRSEEFGSLRAAAAVVTAWRPSAARPLAPSENTLRTVRCTCRTISIEPRLAEKPALWQSSRRHSTAPTARLPGPPSVFSALGRSSPSAMPCPHRTFARNHSGREEQIVVAFDSTHRIARHARQSFQHGLDDVDETGHPSAVTQRTVEGRCRNRSRMVLAIWKALSGLRSCRVASSHHRCR